MPSLERPDGMIQIPNFSSEVDTVEERKIFTGDGIEKFRLRDTGRSDLAGAEKIQEIGPAPVTELDGLFPEPGIIPVPGDQFGDVLGIHVLGTEIEHQSISLKRHHFIRVDFDNLFRRPIQRNSPPFIICGVTS